MNVLFITTIDLEEKSGQNIATKQILNVFERSPDHDLKVICPKPKHKNEFKNYFYLPPKKYGKLIWFVILQFFIVVQFFRSVRRRKPDVVIGRVRLCFTLPLLIKIYNLRYYLLIRGTSIAQVKKDSTFKITYLLWKYSVYLNLRYSHKVILAFNEIKKALYPFNSKDNYVLFTNGVDPCIFPLVPMEEARKKLRIPDNAFVVGFAGSMKEKHRVDLLIRAASRLKREIEDLKLLLVGDGPYLHEIESMIHEYNLYDHSILTGNVDHNQVVYYMTAADILYGVIDPETAENPIKCYEYMAAGRPIITSHKEEFYFVREKNFGVTIENLSENEVQKAIEILYSTEKKKREMMGIKAREYVFANHAWDDILNIIE